MALFDLLSIIVQNYQKVKVSLERDGVGETDNIPNGIC